MKRPLIYGTLLSLAMMSSARAQSARKPDTLKPRPATPSPWSGSASIGMALRSAILPGVAETSFGIELKVGVMRALPSGSLMLSGNLSYQRDKPAVAATNEWSIAAGWRHTISKRVVALGRTMIGANRVQEVEFRSATFVGIGPYLVKTPRISLLVAPGVGYSKVEQTQRGSVLAFANGEPSGASGIVMGFHDMLMVQLSPMLTLQQNALWLHKAGSFRNNQLQFEARLTGMVTAHVGMLIVYNEQYDSSMPAPVNKSVRSLNSGIQLKF
jgi:putative salt-induced outer membrane protein YdiY